MKVLCWRKEKRILLHSFIYALFPYEKFKLPDSCMIKIFHGGGKGGDTLKTPSPLRTTFAFSHPLFYDVFGKTP